MNGEDKSRNIGGGESNAGQRRGNGAHDGESCAHLTAFAADEEIAPWRRIRVIRPRPSTSPGASSSSPRKALMIFGVALLILLLAGALTLIGGETHERALAKETERSTVPTVAVIHPLAENRMRNWCYLAHCWRSKNRRFMLVPMGTWCAGTKISAAEVKEGDLLATIDTPEVDQELNQTRAARQQIVAQLELAKISAERWENLRKSDSVSAQEADQQTSGYKQAQANLAAADANVRRLEQMEDFKKVYAPFSGVLTKRNVDPGALINAGAGAAGRELFDIARVDPLRVYTSVPQAYAPFIKVGAGRL